MRFMRWLRVANARAEEQGREVRARHEAQRAANEAAGLPAGGTRRPSHHPKGSIIAIIWCGLFVLGFIGAAVFHDNNPNTDDAAGWGALIGVAGTALTAVYVIGSIVGNGLRSLVKRRKP